MYTIVNYLYRDASNYKRLNQVCFLGTLSEHQKARIIGSLYEGEYFIPSAIGWDEERISADYNDDDGCWFELTKDDFLKCQESRHTSFLMNGHRLRLSRLSVLLIGKAIWVIGKCSVKWAADLSAAHFWEFRYFTIHFGVWN